MIAGTALAETMIASPKVDPEGFQASYLRALLGLAGFLVASAIVLAGLARLGNALR